MKLLLDENLPHDLRQHLPGHDVFTVAFLGWTSIKNGELLKRAAVEGFGAVLTKDSGIEYEHNLAELPIAVVIIRAKTNSVPSILPLVPKVLEALATLQPKTLVKVE